MKLLTVVIQRSVKLFFIRHGDDVGSQMEKFDDLPLTIEGESQSRKMVDILKKYNITSIYSSPMLRTKQTAEIIAEPFQIQVIADDNLRDRDVGSAKGLSYNLVREKFEKLLRENTYRMDFKFPDGESNFDVYERAGKFLARVLHPSKGVSEGIVIVSHPLILNYLIYQLIGLGFKEGLYYAFEPATIAVFQLQENYYQLLRFA